MKRLLGFCHLAFALDIYQSRNNSYYYRLEAIREPDPTRHNRNYGSAPKGFLLFWIKGTVLQHYPFFSVSKCFLSFFVFFFF